MPSRPAHARPLTGEPPIVAVLGLGAMGSRIAAHLLDTGYQVVVWNRNRGKAVPMVDRGATLATTPADAARRCQFLITMVADAAALAAVSEGSDGFIAGIEEPAVVIDMSTVGTHAISRLAALLPVGSHLLDAPVLGSLDEAESGSLTIFVGGDAEVYEFARPLLAELGRPLRCGPVGAGAAAKLVANAALLLTMCGLGEVLALSERLGLTRELAFQVLEATPMGPQAKRRQSSIAAGSFPPRFQLRLASKDAKLILDALGSSQQRFPLLSGTRDWYVASEQAGSSNDDYTAVLANILSLGTARKVSGTAAVPTPESSVKVGGLIIDLDGVVWRSDRLIPRSVEAITLLRRKGIRVAFATNDPSRTRWAIAELLTQAGVPTSAHDVFTASGAIATLLNSKVPPVQDVLVVGPRALGAELEAQGIHLAPHDVSGCDAVVVGGHEGFDYSELRRAADAVRAGAGLFATGRDAVFPGTDSFYPATGAVLAAIETASGGSATVLGKPEPFLFQIALEALGDCGPIAVVGDNLAADIAGARRVGLLAILVLTGVAKADDVHDAVHLPDLVVDDLLSLALIVE